MPLLDHFHPPLSETRHWESFHARWAAAIADALNEKLLPAGYYAEEQVHVGSRVEIDVATFDPASESRRDEGGLATLTRDTWAPPAPDQVFPAVFPDSIEVLVFNGEAGPTLVAAVELVSPGNKDRVETRRAFVAKCTSYLQQGVGLIVVDTVTSRRANLHDEMMRQLEVGEQPLLQSVLYAVAYRPVREANSQTIEAWTRTLSVGGSLPIMPLAIDKGVVLPLDLELSYSDARRRRRID